ncbi:MAG: hypothetical protein KatS3mg121_0369 [Gammaproteobacteria bacterium]|nr:MAG: hypothetical protein KatS3mg121_0369 [Gammaproteobacteria bacterium]
MKLRLLVLLALGLLAACGGKELDLVTAEEDAQQLYERARGHLDGARFEQAIRYFKLLETRYPFSPYALQAQLDLAYAYLLYGQTEKAIAEAERFIRFNPTHPQVAYAYYLKGVAAFGRRRAFEGWFPRNPADYDKKPLEEAFATFKQLVERHPNSPYAADAYRRMVYLANLLARHELEVARFYAGHGAWIAAANRITYLLEHFPRSPSAREALPLLVEAYRALGAEDAAADAERLLRLNAPRRATAVKDGSRK